MQFGIISPNSIISFLVEKKLSSTSFESNLKSTKPKLSRWIQLGTKRRLRAYHTCAKHYFVFQYPLNCYVTKKKHQYCISLYQGWCSHLESDWTASTTAVLFCMFSPNTAPALWRAEAHLSAGLEVLLQSLLLYCLHPHISNDGG